MVESIYRPRVLHPLGELLNESVIQDPRSTKLVHLLLQFNWVGRVEGSLSVIGKTVSYPSDLHMSDGLILLGWMILHQYSHLVAKPDINVLLFQG